MIYTKPVLLRNEDMAEGVYAGSGDFGQPSVQVVFTENFGSEYYKQTRFKILLSGDLGVQVEVTLEFDKAYTRLDVEGGTINGNVITLNNPKNEHWLHVEGDWDIQCTKATVRKTLQTWG